MAEKLKIDFGSILLDLSTHKVSRQFEQVILTSLSLEDDKDNIADVSF